MTTARSLVSYIDGTEGEAKDTDTQLVSGTLTTNTGQQLTILSATSPIILGSDTSLASAKVFDGTSGVVKLNLLFFINGVAVGATVTAANLNTLTNGSNASALHYHTANPVSGLTLWSTPVVGEIGYQTPTANTLARARANAISTCKGVCVVYAGVAGSALPLSGGGPVMVLFEAGLNGGATGAPAAQQDVFVSSGVAGRASNNAPTASGSVVANIGTIKDPLTYDNTNGSLIEIWPHFTVPIPRA